MIWLYYSTTLLVYFCVTTFVLSCYYVTTMLLCYYVTLLLYYFGNKIIVLIPRMGPRSEGRGKVSRGGQWWPRSAAHAMGGCARPAVSASHDRPLGNFRMFPGPQCRTPGVGAKRKRERFKEGATEPGRCGNIKA